MSIPDWNNSTVWTEISFTWYKRSSLRLPLLKEMDCNHDALWIGKYGPLNRWGVLQLVKRQFAKTEWENKGVNAFREVGKISPLRRYTAAVNSQLAVVGHTRGLARLTQFGPTERM